ncbi:MAG: hypothetical protein FWC43_03970 [Planctomycetaceae bacterium]|nr:hypothetical protein [Planctomycetaceae bacterium]
MNRSDWAIGLLFFLLLFSGLSENAAAKAPSQYILVNLHRHELTREVLLDIKQKISGTKNDDIQIGVSAIYSYLQIPKDDTVAEQRFLEQLKNELALLQEFELPVLVQLDGEQWWGARSDLWNWWDPAKPGYDPKNAENVEWTDWGPQHAIKIAWRNWGRQLRVLPPPNLMSPAYVAAWEEKMEKIVPVILEWEKSLPDEQKHLFVGIKVGWESSVGVNAWYYPDGNDLLDKPNTEDPQTGLNGKRVPDRGVQTIGYAAVKTAGIRDHGPITEADLAEIARRHLESLSKKAAELGVPRERLFTHGAAWKEEELLYNAAVNQYSCPGWSFYDYAPDPRQDKGVQRALETSDAPYWAVTEWLLFHDDQAKWTSSLTNALSPKRVRYICIFNWNSIKNSNTIHEAIKNVCTVRRQVCVLKVAL